MKNKKNTNRQTKIADKLSGQFRRYLVDIDTSLIEQQVTDCLIIGSGVAGLRAAIEAAKDCSVIIVCKKKLADSNTFQAQGGIASVVEKDDSFESHIADTIRTGCGISNEQVVEMVVRQGPELVRELIEWGAKFDMAGDHLMTTLEGGHSHRRIAHAHGDQTGRIIAQTLARQALQNKNIKIIEDFYAIDLLTDDENRCTGIVGKDQKGFQIIRAANTILASGGAGQLYRETTNPDIATADGIALSWRAGAVLSSLEFVQFHPTTLYVAGASRALITEALRGEGAVLVDSRGKAFMKEYHPDAELAPRDVVSRACLTQMLKTKSTHVYLDVRNFNKEHFAQRFPQIYGLCESFDIDISKDLIPVRPSAHYMIGGVKTDIRARTSIENLYACGEAASTGLHGANRLASNSLLEGLVFGRIAGTEAVNNGGDNKPLTIKYKIQSSDRTLLDTADVRNSLRALMWRNVGITRKSRGLREALEIIKFWQRYVMDKVFDYPAGWECQNMLTASLLMARCAQLRRESRGVHFRQDFPETNDKIFKADIEISVHSEVVRHKQ
jgi:L-aspartate oxidase